MATINGFEDLEVWQLSRNLSNQIYPITFFEPIKSDYRIRDQMRGSTGSVMDNIAEGLKEGVSLNSLIPLEFPKAKLEN